MIKIFLMLITFFVFPGLSFAGDSITKAQVNDLLKNWITAQNTGSYSNYANLYATKFCGVKRSGYRTSRFNRDTWLKDRVKMFKKKMEVTISDPEVNLSGMTATAKFEQTWESGNYRDKGEKSLFLALENGKLKIAREEMLFSKKLDSQHNSTISSKLPFAFAIKEGIVVEGYEIEPASINIKPKLISKGTDYIASAPVDKKVLPQEIQSLIGMQVRLYNAKGSCESKINGFKLVSKELPSNTDVETWNSKKTSDSGIAAMVMSSGERYLVATTEKCSGNFAKASSLPQSPIAMSQKTDQETQRKVWHAFKALPLYKKEIKPYEKETDKPNLHKFVLNINGKTSTWISLFVSAGDYACGSEGGVFGALWKVEDNSRGSNLKFVRYIEEDIDYATDIEKDGSPEFFYTDYFHTYIGFMREDKSKDIRFNEVKLNSDPC